MRLRDDPARGLLMNLMPLTRVKNDKSRRFQDLQRNLLEDWMER